MTGPASFFIRDSLSSDVAAIVPAVGSLTSAHKTSLRNIRMCFPEENEKWHRDLRAAWINGLHSTVTEAVLHFDGVPVTASVAAPQGITEQKMRERAALLGGIVGWRNGPGKGTTVTVNIPRPGKGPAPGKWKPIEHENSFCHYDQDAAS